MRIGVVLGIVAFMVPGTLAGQQSVEYRVAFPNFVHHEAEVEAVFRGVAAGVLEVRMSRTSPGRYALHEFAKNVYNVRAFDGRGQALVVTRPDPHQWHVAGHDGTVRFAYTLYADHADGTYSGIDATHAHLNMPATFAWARGLADAPITVTFSPPAGSGWKVATQLATTADPTTFTAPHLQYFMDSPTEVSAFTLREWTVESKGKRQRIRLAVHHEGTEAEVDAYAEMARKVVEAQQAIYGELPEFDYGTYTFLADYNPWVSGDGMEHRNSTVLASRRTLSGSGARGNLGTLSHEFFHAWNIERIRPRSLEPFDFEEANMSGELWLGEGFTSYYDDLAIRRAGLSTVEEYARGVGELVHAVANAPGRRYFSPVEMSMQAPFVDAAVSIDPTNRANTFLSYYTWGAGIGLGLDLTLRTGFPGVGLDHFMRALWQRHGRHQANQTPVRPYTLEDLEAALAQVTGDAAFAGDFFRRYIRGRDVVDYEALLAGAGLLLRRARPGQPWLGAPGLEYAEGAAVVTEPTPVGSPLYEAGVDTGDRILRLDGQPVGSAAELEAVLAGRRPGEALALRYEQRGRPVDGTVTLADDPRLEVVTYEEAGRPVTAAMLRFREAWLGK